MTWTAPTVTRIEEPMDADERTTLETMLDSQRVTTLHKCAGLTGDALAQRSVPPSTLTLLGLIRHLAKVERIWFRIRFAGEPIESLYPLGTDVDFDDLDPDAAESDYAILVGEIEAARATVVDADLEDTFTAGRHGRATLRWLYLHMIEEYARHNGHADLLRERIDGTAGG